MGDALHALVVTGGRVRRFAVGPVAAAVQALTYAHFTLRQAARGRPAQVGAAGERLQARCSVRSRPRCRSGRS